MFGFGSATRSNQHLVPILPHTNPDPIIAPAEVGVAPANLTPVYNPLLINPLRLTVTVLATGQAPAPVVPVPQPVGTVASTMYNGMNLVSMESVTYNQYSASSGPPTGNYPIYSDNLLNYLSSKGVTSVRFLYSWEAVQSSLGGTVPSSIGGLYSTYWNRYVNTINRMLDRGMKVMVEPWQYNNSHGDTDVCYRGGTFTTTQFQDFHGKMATAINSATNNNQNVSFGLMNEPHQNAVVGGSTVAGWYAYAQAAINGIRNSGNINTIWIPGWNYTDCGSFVSNGSAAQHLLLTDSLNNLGVTVHNYNGQGVGEYNTNPGNASNTTALRDACSSLLSWSRANGNIKINIGEIAIDAGSNNGTLLIAQNQWADWQAFCVTNKDVITGWNWWASSEDAWWNTGDSRASSGFHWGLTNGLSSSSYPSSPISSGSYTRGTAFTLADSIALDWFYVPTSYDTTHNTPTKLFIYLHGCTGYSSGDIWTISPGGTQDWISLCPNGTGDTEGGCWGTASNPTGTVNRVLTAIAYAKTRFNIDPSKVFIGGYSSGGNLTYETIFRHSHLFAGAITQNTHPWSNNSLQNSTNAFAANIGHKFHIAHQLHTSDTSFPRAGVVSAFNACTTAGYPVNLSELAGGHSDGNTWTDLRAFFPQWLAAGWSAPSTSVSGINPSVYMNLIQSSLGKY